MTLEEFTPANTSAFISLLISGPVTSVLVGFNHVLEFSGSKTKSCDASKSVCSLLLNLNQLFSQGLLWVDGGSDWEEENCIFCSLLEFDHS